jgi:hypothetical protein
LFEVPEGESTLLQKSSLGFTRTQEMYSENARLILATFASAFSQANRQERVFTKSVDYLNVGGRYATSAAFTRWTVDIPLPTILATLRTDCEGERELE